MIARILTAAALAAFALSDAPLALAQQSAQNSAEAQEWRSLRYEEVRMRVGPSQDYPIDWVYKRKGMPVIVIRKREAWSLVADHEGTRGWIADSQLSGVPGAMVVGEGETVLRDAPSKNGKIRWRAQPGVVGTLGSCQPKWCEIDVDGRTGWVLRDRLWGANAPNAPVTPEE